MSDMDESKFLETFFLLIPNFDCSDDEILNMLKLTVPMVSKKRFGNLYEQALVYLVAHRLTVQKVIDSLDGGAMSSVLTAGDVVSEKEGDLQRSYGTRTSSVSTDDDLLKKTAYGLEYLRIRAMCLLTGMTRFG